MKLHEQVIDIAWLFNTGQDNRKAHWDLVKGDRDHLIEVTATA